MQKFVEVYIHEIQGIQNTWYPCRYKHNFNYTLWLHQTLAVQYIWNITNESQTVARYNLNDQTSSESRSQTDHRCMSALSVRATALARARAGTLTSYYI